MGTFKIATYNVNSIRSRLPIVISWLRENRPDVLCLQETKVEDGSFPFRPFEETGYRVYFKGEKRYNGVAIASLAEPTSLAFGMEDEAGGEETRLIRGVFEGITVINTYVPQGRERTAPQFAYKLEWFSRFHRLLKRSCSLEERVVWCGDLNVAPEPIDVYDPKRLLGHVCFTPEVWDAFAEVVAWGLADVYRKHHPGEAGRYTFFDYRFPRTLERGLGWRIDHILATRTLADRSLGAEIDLGPRRAERPSDHTVLFALFEKNS